MSRSHPRGLVVRIVAMAVAMVGVGLSPIAVATSASAAPGDTGYRDFQYDNGVGDDAPDASPTASKPQSKLWFAHDQWWGALKNPTDGKFHIYGFNRAPAAQEAGQAWVDTGVVADDRSGVDQVDVLWDQSRKTLFVLGHGREGQSSKGIRVSQFTYDPAATAWNVGPFDTVNDSGVEAAVIAEDTTGRLWVAYTAVGSTAKQVRLIVSDTNQVFSEPAQPFTPPVDGTTVNKDDIASVIAHDGVVSLVWSNQSTDPDNTLAGAIYVATHPDTEADPRQGWTDTAAIVQGDKAGDDHISMTSVEGTGDGSVYVVVKTGADDLSGTENEALIQLLVLRNDTWEVHDYANVASDLTRPIVLLEPSERRVHVLATAPVGGGVIYEKTADMDAPVFQDQGRGEPFIKLASDPSINNATSTKQNITPTRGMLVLASDRSTGHYVHNYVPGALTPPVPEAEFTPSVTSGVAPLEVTFSDNSSHSPSSWAWDFGDGSTSTEQSPKHTYAEPGPYTVTLTASVPGASTTMSHQVTVEVEPVAVPTAAFTAAPESATVPLTVQFTDSSTGASSWAWDFGDGGTSADQNPTHTFTAAGSYTVSLVASNDGGASTPATRTITVAAAPGGNGGGGGGNGGGGNGGGGNTGGDTGGGTGGGGNAVEPVAGFTFSPGTGTSPLTVQFTDSSTGQPTGWSWEFGDGETSTEQNPRHTYTRPGNYKVTLTVTNADGQDTVVDRQAVRVYSSARPVVSFFGHWVRFLRSAYVTASWRGAADAVPAGAFDLKVSVAGLRGRWSRQVLPMNHHDARLEGQPGSTYCLHVRGLDALGSAGRYSEAWCTAVPLDDRNLAQKGHWREQTPKRSYLGTALRTRAHGATLSKRVRGKHVSLLVTKVPDGGRLAVYRGHRLVRHVSLRSSSVKRMRFVRIASYHRARTARFRIVVVSRHRLVIIDGLAVSRK